MDCSVLRGGILADDMGLGKTLTTAVYLHTVQLDVEPDSTDRSQPSLQQPRRELNVPTTITEATAVDLSGDSDDEDFSAFAAPAGPVSAAPPTDSNPTQVGLETSVGASYTREEQDARDDALQQCKDSRLRWRLRSIQARKFKPILIAVPSLATTVWRNEFHKHLPGANVKYWMHSPSSSQTLDANSTIGTSHQDLVKLIYKLGDQPSAARAIILTSLGTLRERSLDFTTQGEISSSRKKAQRKVTTGAEDGGEIDEDDEDQGDLDPSDYYSRISGLFSRVVIDEAHYIKRSNTLTNLAVDLLAADVVILLSGTPMANGVADLHGLLYVLWRRNPSLETIPLEEYREALGVLQDHPPAETRELLKRFGHLLDPSSFRQHMKNIKGSPPPARTIEMVLPCVLLLCQLRRTMASQLIVDGATIQVAHTLPPYRLKCVELEMDNQDAKAYNRVHVALAPYLSGSYDEKSETGRINIDIHRQLCHQTTNGLSELFANNVDVKTLNKWYQSTKDHGVSRFWRMTRARASDPIYRDRVSMVKYLTQVSPKLRWIVAHAGRVCLSGNRRLLLFMNLPFDQFMVEAVLGEVGFRVLGVKSMHNAQEREEARRRFTDASDSAQVFVTTLRVGATSINLQDQASDIVFGSMPTNVAELHQAIGRLFRLGQTRTVNGFILCTDHTYDQSLQARVARKYISQIIGTSRRPEAKDVAASKHEPDVDTSERANEETDDVDLDLYNDELVDEAAELCRVTLGQRSSRHRWLDNYDLTAKDHISEERRFRQEVKAREGAPSGFQRSAGVRESWTCKWPPTSLILTWVGP